MFRLWYNTSLLHAKRSAIPCTIGFFAACQGDIQKAQEGAVAIYKGQETPSTDVRLSWKLANCFET